MWSSGMIKNIFDMGSVLLSLEDENLRHGKDVPSLDFFLAAAASQRV